MKIYREAPLESRIEITKNSLYTERSGHRLNSSSQKTIQLE